MLDRDGPVLWYGPLPGPIARHIFLCDMQEKYGECYLPEIQDLMIQSALARGDEATAETYYIDTLAAQKGCRVTRISKFSPGEHFYIGREKFNTLEKAQVRAVELGYLVLPGVYVQSMNDFILAVRNKK